MTRSILVCVTAMRLINLVSPQQPAQQGQGGINNEYPQQDEPTPEELRRDPCGLQGKATNDNPQETATSIPHEDPRRREIPEKEPRHRGCQQRRQPNALGCLIGTYTTDHDKQGSANAHTHSLNAGNPIDTVHEIVEIEHPYQIERRSYVSNPPQIDHKAEKGQCRQTSKPVQQPASTGEMAEQTPTGSDMAMIVEEAQQCDPNTRPQDTSGQIRFHRAQYRRKQHCQQEGEHDSDTAPLGVGTW